MSHVSNCFQITVRGLLAGTWVLQITMRVYLVGGWRCMELCDVLVTECQLCVTITASPHQNTPHGYFALQPTLRNPDTKTGHDRSFFKLVRSFSNLSSALNLKPCFSFCSSLSILNLYLCIISII